VAGVLGIAAPVFWGDVLAALLGVLMAAAAGAAGAAAVAVAVDAVLSLDSCA
jgi:hypothetical protein